MIYYIRDEKGNLLGFKYNNELYYYITNIQGDIVGILNSNYQEIAHYSYDSYGKLMSIKDINGIDVTEDQNHIGNINPFRYRGYYYDNETSLYYLNSRYYNPDTGRFINADGIIGSDGNILSYNLYLYTGNKYIGMYDENGEFSVSLLFKKIWSGIKKEIVRQYNHIVEFISNPLKFYKEAYTNPKTYLNFIGPVSIINENISVVKQGIETYNILKNGNEEEIGERFGAALVQTGEILLFANISSKLSTGRGIKVGKDVTLLYENPSFKNKYHKSGITFFNVNGTKPSGNYGSVFRFDWDPKDGFHIHK